MRMAAINVKLGKIIIDKGRGCGRWYDGHMEDVIDGGGRV